MTVEGASRIQPAPIGHYRAAIISLRRSLSVVIPAKRRASLDR